MGHGELLNALHRKGEEQAAAIRRAADEEEEGVRAAATSRIDQLREEHERRCGAACAVRQHEVVAAAEREATLLRIRAENELALRLRQRATACLERLRDGEYANLFRLLAEELPPAGWETIRVNPLDAPLAASLFPGAEVVVDPSIIGGLEAATADGTLTVINTLESRLARGWNDLLPALVAELRGIVP